MIYRHLVLIALLAVMLLLQSMHDSLGSWFEYQRAAILDGEVWRLISGHFTHINWSHLLLNLAGLALIWVLGFGRLGIIRQLYAIFFCSLAISCALLVFNTDIAWYQGFSGVLHGLFAVIAAQYLTDHKYFSLLLFLSLAIKIAHEQLVGRMPWHQEFTDFLVVADAHLYGAIAGLVIAVMYFLPRAPSQNRDVIS